MAAAAGALQNQLRDLSKAGRVSELVQLVVENSANQKQLSWSTRRDGSSQRVPS
jgi:hypothetical protein